jgi:hypothetical protein
MPETDTVQLKMLAERERTLAAQAATRSERAAHERRAEAYESEARSIVRPPASWFNTCHD